MSGEEGAAAGAERASSAPSGISRGPTPFLEAASQGGAHHQLEQDMLEEEPPKLFGAAQQL